MTLIMQVHLISDVHDAKHLLILMSDCDKAAIKNLSQEVSCCVLTKKLPNPQDAWVSILTILLMNLFAHVLVWPVLVICCYPGIQSEMSIY